MEFRFISNKPWVDDTIRLRKALVFTTLAMAILGLILVIIGVILLAYMEFVVGVVSIIFGILIPLGYLGANVLLFARRRKSYDKSMIIEYRFTEDALEIIKLSDDFKAKSVVAYNSFSVNKVYNKSRFVVLKTNNCYADIIVIRKKDIVLEEGQVQNQAIVSFVSFLMAKVAEANRTAEVTCEDAPMVAQQAENSSTDTAQQSDEPTVDEAIDTSSVEFDDLTESDEVNDIVDEKADIETTPLEVKYDVIEEPIEENGTVEEPTSEESAVDDAVEEDVALDSEEVDTEDSLFDYGETVVQNDDLVSAPHEDKNYFHDYSYGEDTKKE